jgi:glucuronate isomerase
MTSAAVLKPSSNYPGMGAGEPQPWPQGFSYAKGAAEGRQLKTPNNHCFDERKIKVLRSQLKPQCDFSKEGLLRSREKLSCNGVYQELVALSTAAESILFTPRESMFRPPACRLSFRTRETANIRGSTSDLRQD